MMSSKDNEVFEAIYANTVRDFRPWSYQGAGVEPLRKRWLNYQGLKNEFPNSKFNTIPMDYFYRVNRLPEIFSTNHFSVLDKVSVNHHLKL